MTVCLLDADLLAEDAGAGTGDVSSAPDDGERGSLPVGGLLGLVGSGAFAVWTSLTCFVC